MGVFNRGMGRGISPVYPYQIKSISVVVNFSGIPTTYTVNKAVLKYDKDFVYSFTLDDGLYSAFLNVYQVYNGGVADDGITYNGFTYTDGCGNLIKFKAGCAIMSVNSIGASLRIAGNLSGYLNVSNIQTLYSAGWDIINHSWSHAAGSSNTPGYILGRPNYPIEITNNVAEFNSYLSAVTGSTFNHFVIPSGDQNYLPSLNDYGMLAIYNQSGSNFLGGSSGYRIDGTELNRPLMLSRTSLDTSTQMSALTTNIVGISANAINGAKYWLNEFTHNVIVGGEAGGLALNFFTGYTDYLFTQHGSAGSDRMWMAPLQEVYEYIRFREDCNITTPVLNGNQMTFDIQHSFSETMLRRIALTVKISSNQNISAVTVSNGYTNTFRGTGSNKIINVERL
jgi:hypothetical protein